MRDKNQSTLMRYVKALLRKLPDSYLFIYVFT
jgi:hypothetical protein